MWDHTFCTERLWRTILDLVQLLEVLDALIFWIDNRTFVVFCGFGQNCSNNTKIDMGRHV